MPELPEVETARLGLTPLLKGQSINGVAVHNGRLRYPVPEELGVLLIGQRLEDIGRRAKYLIFRFQDYNVVVHLGMSGSLVVVDKAQPLRKHDHIEVDFGRESLRYHDPRRFGSWQIFPVNNALPFQHLGPEPLSDEFEGHYLFEQTRKLSSGIKVAIMDQKRVVGVGNIYANEALFVAGIHPARPANSLSFGECHDLVQAIKRILDKAIKQGGTTLRDFRDPLNNPGYFAQQLLVYDRVKQPCTQCGGVIQKVVLGQRSTFFCPECQQ